MNNSTESNRTYCKVAMSEEDCVKANLKEEQPSRNLKEDSVSSINVKENDVSSSNVKESDVSSNKVTENDVSSSNVTENDVSSSNVTENDVSCSNVTENDVSSINVKENDESSSNVKENDVSSSNGTEYDVFSSNVKEDHLSSSNVKEDDVSSSNVKEDDMSNRNVKGYDVSSSNVTGDEVSSSNVKEDDVSSSNVKEDDVSSSNVKVDDVSSSNVKEDDVSSSNVKEDDVSSSNVKVDDVSSSNVKVNDVSSSNVKEDDVSSSNVKEDDVSSSRSSDIEDSEETILRRQSLRMKFRDSYCGELGKDLNDKGTSAYCSLVAASLCYLYEYAEYDRPFIDNTVETLAQFLGVTDEAKESAMSIARGDEEGSCQQFADFIREQKLVKDHGTQIILYHLLILSIKDGVYDTRSRSLIRYISWFLKIDWNDVEDYEDYLVDMFTDEDHELTEEERHEKAKKKKKRKLKKIAMIGGATLGGLLIGLTGGLGLLVGAPLIASTCGVAVMGSICGAAGAKLAHYKMKKRVGDVEEFEFEGVGDEDRSMHITVAITGWVTKEQTDFTLPWQCLDDSSEQYSLKYESKHMLEVGAVISYLNRLAIRMGVIQLLKHTLLEGIWQSIKLPLVFVSLANIIDNPWNVATKRTVGVGKELAQVLLSRQQGQRPVTLIGFTFGARVIYNCLQELAKSTNHAGIIEDVVMLGTPVTADPEEWENIKSVVSGRIVNGYCRGDWLLKTVYRTASLQTTVAGLEPVEWKDRRMVNIDLTDIVTNHQDYLDNLDIILDMAGVRTKPYNKPEPSALKSLEQMVKKNKELKMATAAEKGASDEKLHNIENEKLYLVKDNQNMELGKIEHDKLNMVKENQNVTGGQELMVWSKKKPLLPWMQSEKYNKIVNEKRSTDL